MNSATEIADLSGRRFYGFDAGLKAHSTELPPWSAAPATAAIATTSAAARPSAAAASTAIVTRGGMLSPLAIAVEVRL